MSDLGDESIEMAQLSEPSAGHRRSSSDRGVLLTPTVSPTKPKSFSSLQVPPDSSVKMTDDNKTPSKDSSHSGVTLEADEFDLEQPVVNKSRLSNFGLPSFLSSTSTPLNQSGLFGHLRRSSTTSGNNPQPPTSKVKSEFDVEKGLAAGNKASEGISIFSRIRPSGASKRGGKMSSTTQNSEDKKSAVAPNRLSKDTLKPLQLSPAAAPSKSEVNELEMMTEPRLSHEIQVSEEQIQPMRIGYEPDFPAEIPSRSRGELRLHWSPACISFVVDPKVLPFLTTKKDYSFFELIENKVNQANLVRGYTHC